MRLVRYCNPDLARRLRCEVVEAKSRKETEHDIRGAPCNREEGVMLRFLVAGKGIGAAGDPLQSACCDHAGKGASRHACGNEITGACGQLRGEELFNSCFK